MHRVVQRDAKLLHRGAAQGNLADCAGCASGPDCRLDGSRETRLSAVRPERQSGHHPAVDVNLADPQGAHCLHRGVLCGSLDNGGREVRRGGIGAEANGVDDDIEVRAIELAVADNPVQAGREHDGRGGDGHGGECADNGCPGWHGGSSAARFEPEANAGGE